MNRVRDGLVRFKNPEYTGVNRCIPCTVVNLVIAFVLAFGVELVAIALDAGSTGLVVAHGIFVGAVAVIYFRGYLVPGTPELTNRYFPSWLLKAFGKSGPVEGLTGTSAPENEGELDAERVLLDAGVLAERADGQDLELTDEFRRKLHAQIDGIEGESASRELLLDVLDIPRGEVRMQEYDRAFRVYRDGRSVGTWESRPAFLADVAAGELLRGRVTGWDGMTVRQRGQLLNGLRLFLETCPGCGGDVSFGVDTVESCCSTREVAAVTCNDCDARVFESNAVP